MRPEPAASPVPRKDRMDPLSVSLDRVSRMVSLTAALLALTVSCGGDSALAGPDNSGGEGRGGGDTSTGALKIATESSGDDLDSDGYSLAVDNGAGQATGVNDTLTVTGLSAGDHQVTLFGVASNCSISGDNPRSVSVAENGTTATTYEVSCDATTSQSGVPAPDSNDVVLYDMRAGGADDLQKGDISTISKAESQSDFLAVDEERGSVNTLGVTNTFLGNGIRAIVLPWLQWAGTDECLGNGAPPDGSQHNLFIGIGADRFKGHPAPGGEIFLQYKRYFGRTANDQSAAAVGPVNDFFVAHTMGGPGGRKETVWNRAGSIRRVTWKRDNLDPDLPAGETWLVRGLRQNQPDANAPIVLGTGDLATEITPWWPDAHMPGGPFTFTLRIKLESSDGAGDGAMTLWVNDTKHQEMTGIGTRTADFEGLEIGGPTWICPPQDQTEYIWDIVVWEQR